ncbi:tyrosine-type recombinase/integrase [Roseixanthobacter pseudopolyaromaticivorans]|uniref:tyrosine-type recombinase/integrase n=1 Tax=Xanthobacteraceae TaxID=335928 RepID=UPI0037265983
MATIRKRTLPSGRPVWQTDYIDGGGKRRHKQFPTKKEADAFLVHARGEVARGIHTADSASITLNAAADLWITACTANRREEATIKRYRATLDLYVRPALGTSKLSRISTVTVQEHIDMLAPTMSRSSLIKVRGAISSVFATAMRKGKAAHNPTHEVVLPSSARREESVEMPTKTELRAILAATPERWLPFMWTALFTGMRASEMRGLLWSDVDLDAGIIRVRRRVDFRNTFGPPKSKAGRRDIPLSPSTTKLLKEWKLRCPNGDLGLVFPNGAGNVESHTNLLRRVFWPAQVTAGVVVMRDALDANGQPTKVPEAKYSLHALRHAAASLFIEQNLTPKKLQTLMGHASIQMTMGVYGKLFASETEDRAAMDAIDRRFSGPD